MTTTTDATGITETNASALRRMMRLAPTTAISEYSMCGICAHQGDDQSAELDEQLDILAELLRHVCTQLVNMREVLLLVAPITVDGGQLTRTGFESLDEALGALARLDDE